jgi:hypothetical protein
VGTPIVECEYLPFVPAKQHRTVGPAYNHHLLFFQVGERSGAKESFEIHRNARGSHNHENNRFIIKRQAKGVPATRRRRLPAKHAKQREKGTGKGLIDELWSLQRRGATSPPP